MEISQREKRTTNRQKIEHHPDGSVCNMWKGMKISQAMAQKAKKSSRQGTKTPLVTRPPPASCMRKVPVLP